jgi:hypothetical protein
MRKVFVLIPDGIGLKNFAYSSFNKLGIKRNYDITYWNNTPFALEDLGFPEIRIINSKPHPLTDILKKAKVQIELNLNIKRSNDIVYDSYRFPYDYSTFKARIKSVCTIILTRLLSSEKGLVFLQSTIRALERKTCYYNDSVHTLKTEQPDLVFCTNQRHINTFAALLAAKDLGIPTVCFIYSWDNLPKATVVVETDYYFVWSDYMKAELQYYYSYIKSEQIIVTGSPQFEMHFKSSKLTNREFFFQQYGLDLQKKYICFSGNDVTSVPDDPKYLEDFARRVKELNAKGQQIGIIFRKCPVDFSNRFDTVIAKYPDEIVAINPLWKNFFSSSWNAIFPTKDDDELFSAIAEHCEMVITIGSSTVFDFIAHNKPTGYIKYNQKFQLNKNWNIYKCYQFIHFRSMPNKNSVFWINHPNEIDDYIAEILDQKAGNIIANAKQWFEIINQHPPQLASERIWTAFDELLN